MLLLLAAQAAATSASPPRQDVVVVGQRPARDDLADCLARGCSPEEEAAAALAAANSHYVAGDYRAARRTLAASLARLRGGAKAHPQAVADLLDGIARIDAHLGQFEDFTTGTRRALLITRDAFGAADRRTVMRRLAAAEAYLTAGHQAQGFAAYAGAVADADAGGDAELRATARLRYASALVRESRRGDERRLLDRLLAPLLTATEPAMAGYRYGAQLAIAKLAAREGDGRPLAALTAAPPPAVVAPLLVAAEQARMPGYRQNEEDCQPDMGGSSGAHAGVTGDGSAILLGCGNVNAQRINQPFEKQWLDLTFDVGADGDVRNVRVARQSGQIEGAWVDEVVETAGARRYAPRPGGAALFRRERYTLTARYHLLTGSRIPVREAKPVIEVVDLSPDRAPYLRASR